MQTLHEEGLEEEIVIAAHCQGVSLCGRFGMRKRRTRVRLAHPSPPMVPLLWYDYDGTMSLVRRFLVQHVSKGGDPEQTLLTFR